MAACFEPLEPRVLLNGDPAASAAVQLFQTTPALFVENQGQWDDPSVRYLHSGSGGASVAMTDAGPVFRLIRDVASEADGECDPLAPFGDVCAPPVVESIRFAATFPGSNPGTWPLGHDRSDSVFNYYVGDPASHRSAVPAYEKVIYPDLYPGTDLHLWGRRDHLKYEFHVEPGSDYTRIAVQYTGIDRLSIDENGALHVHLPDGWGELIDNAPYIYQMIDGEQIEVPGRYALIDERTYAFAVTGSYDAALKLIFDPQLNWSTYIGGVRSDHGRGIAIDESGNVLVTGLTDSSGWASGGYNTTYDAGDAFIVKLSPDGVHIWSTYIGGNDADAAYDLFIDAGGHIIVTGLTYSCGWTSGGYDAVCNGGGDAFAAKLSPAGTHHWSTYLGGELHDTGIGVSVDSLGNIVITGTTLSPEWVITGYQTIKSGGYDAFVVKLSPHGDHLWSTYIGGAGTDDGTGVAIDGSNAIIVAGWTYASGWAAGGYNTIADYSTSGFVTKLTSSGEHLWSTYIGGALSDRCHSISIDPDGNVFVTGETYSSSWMAGGFDTTYNGNGDAFVVSLSPIGMHRWSTYLGGEHVDVGRGITIDAAKNVLVTGSTSSPGWAVGTLNTTHNGFDDGFVARLSANGEHHWSSYIGGSNSDSAWAIATHATGSIAVTGDTSVAGWASGGYDTTFNGIFDGFVVHFVDELEFVTQLSHSMAEIIARDLAYRDWTVGISLGVGDYTVDQFWDDGMGFQAIALISPTTDPLIAFRGTDPANELYHDLFVADLNRYGVGYNQFVHNRQLVRDWVISQDRPVDVIGHSLGGALTQWFAADLTSINIVVDQIITFNSPGISAATASSFQPGLAREVMHYVVSGDIVSLAGEAFIAGAFTIISYFDVNPINKHLLPVLNPTIGDRIRPEGLDSPAAFATFPTVHILNDEGFGYSGLDHYAFLLGFQLATIIVPAFHPFVWVPAALLQRGTAEGARREIGEVVADIVSAISFLSGEDGRVTLSLPTGSTSLFRNIGITIDTDLTVERAGDSLAFAGHVGVKVGEFAVELPSWAGGAYSGSVLAIAGTARIDSREMVLSGEVGLLGGGLASANGSLVLNWAERYASVAGTLDVLRGMVQISGSVKVDADVNVTLYGGAAVTAPSWLGGYVLGSAQAMIRYINDDRYDNDFIAGWGVISLPFFGSFTLGVRMNLDGSYGVLGAEDIPSLLEGGGGAGDGALRQFAVPAEREFVLFGASWGNDADDVALRLTLPDGTVLDEAAIGTRMDMAMVPDLSGARSRYVIVTNPAAGTWTVGVEDAAALGEVEFSALGSAEVGAVTVNSVMQEQGGPMVSIGYTATDADSQAEVSLYYDDDAEGYDGLFITSGLPEQDGAGEFQWSTIGVVPGQYHVYAVLDDGVNPPVFSAYSATMITVGPVGDLNFDSLIDANDIDALVAATAGGDENPLFDLNEDGVVNTADTDYLIRFILNTEHGDANLDGLVNITDLATVATHFGGPVPGTWAKGNFVGVDGVNIADLARVATFFGFERNVAGGTGAGREGGVDLLAEASAVVRRRVEVVVTPVVSVNGVGTAGGTWGHIAGVLSE